MCGCLLPFHSLPSSLHSLPLPPSLPLSLPPSLPPSLPLSLYPLVAQLSKSLVFPARLRLVGNKDNDRTHHIPSMLQGEHTHFAMRATDSQELRRREREREREV